MKDKIMVSICCTAYNHEKYIREALDSFLMQKTNFEYEVIINDDCSTDNTASIIREYQENILILLNQYFNKKINIQKVKIC